MEEKMKKLFASVFIMMLVTSLFAGGGQSAPVTQAPAQGSIGPTNSNPLSDIRVRQALNYAIDKAALCKTILQDTVVLADSLTPNGEGKATGLNNYAYNPQKAMELLKEAKWDPNYVLNVRYYYQDQQTVDLMTAI
jgi:peptide/nickel transport system substrate-binding protein